MGNPQTMMAQQVGRAAMAFERQRTGHEPDSVRVVLGADTLVVTLYGALSPAERALAADPAGAAKVQEFHRQLFATASGPLRREISRITGVEVREASAEVASASDAVVSVFTTGTVVQVFLLAGAVPPGMWSDIADDGSGRPSLVEPTRAGRQTNDGKTRHF